MQIHFFEQIVFGLHCAVFCLDIYTSNMILYAESGRYDLRRGRWMWFLVSTLFKRSGEDRIMLAKLAYGTSLIGLTMPGGVLGSWGVLLALSSIVGYLLLLRGNTMILEAK
ncbi:MAG: hypothetical protein AAGF55_01065 [Pseudomonadota bacterium]